MYMDNFNDIYYIIVMYMVTDSVGTVVMAWYMYALCNKNNDLGIIHYFQHFHKSTGSMLGGGGKFS